MSVSDDIKSRLAKTKVAFIGAGRMGEALMKGMLAGGIFQPKQVVLSDVQKERLTELAKKYQVNTTDGNPEAIEQAQVIFLAVKPQQLDDVLREISPRINDDHLLISIVAGVTTRRICEILGRQARVVRVMPNTPALVGAGISVISRGEFAIAGDEALVKTLFSAIGEVVNLPEDLQNVSMALSGCGPAYFYLFIKTLAEAGVQNGLSQEIALKLAVETMVGAGEMLKRTGQNPQALIDMVASPGGTTLAALSAFEETGFRASIFKAVKAAVKRAYELGG